MNFLSKKEIAISKSFKNKGYVVFDIEQKKELNFIKNYMIKLIKKKIKS